MGITREEATKQIAELFAEFLYKSQELILKEAASDRSNLHKLVDYLTPTCTTSVTEKDGLYTWDISADAITGEPRLVITTDKVGNNKIEEAIKKELNKNFTEK